MTGMEGRDVQDTEAGIYARVHGTGGEAGKVGDDDRGGCQGVAGVIHRSRPLFSAGVRDYRLK